MNQTPRRWMLCISLTMLASACNNGKDTDTDTDDTDVVDTTAPVITVVGDNPTIIAEGDTFTDPGATATDDIDGDVEVTATSDVDADRDGTYTVTYTATDAAGNTATATREVIVEFGGQLALATVGANLALIGVLADGTLVERDRAELGAPVEHYSSNHVAFSITAHPTLPNTVFVTSLNECASWGIDNVGCWGNARIDRYTFDANTVTHDGLAFLMQAPLRLTTPSYDAGTGVTTIPILNQGSAPITLTSAVVTDLDVDASFSSACDGLELQPGASCNVTITEGAVLADNVLIDLVTSLGEAEGYFYRDDDALVVGGPDFDDELAGLPSCAWDSSDDFQVGECAPTAMAFSADGTRAYVNDDDHDAVIVFAVDGSGDLTFLNVSDDVVYQGIAVNGANTALYNGANVLQITGDVVTEVLTDEGGNATEVVTDTTGKELMVTTYDNTTLQVWDISVDPLAPTLISEVDPAESRARYQHHDADLSQFVTVDHEVITSITFDGAVLAEVDSLEVPLDFYTCPNEDDCYGAYYRAVQMTGDGSMAVASGFVNPEDQETFEALPYMGFLTSFAFDPTTFAITEQSTLELDGSARSILFVETP
jgi:hypothetical protein